MRCTCGFENAPEARFCGQCGVVVGAPTAGTIPSAATPPVVPPVPARTGKAGGRQASRALMAVMALVVVIIAAGYWWLNRPPERYKPDNSGLYLIKVDGKYGYMDRTGKTVITPQFDQAGGFSEELAPVVFGTKVGYIDTKGGVVITPQFDRLDGRVIGADPLAIHQFRYGRAMVVLGGMSGFIGKDGRYVHNPDLRSASWFSEEMAPVTTAAGEAAFVDRSGRVVMAGKFEHVEAFSDGLAPAATGERWGFINRTGEWIINPQFDGVMNFADGLAPVFVGGRTGYIDKTGKFVVNPQYDVGLDFHDGFALFQSGEKWGYIDASGRVVGDAKFAAGGHFSDGLAPVKTDDGWGYIDATGKMIVSPQFDYAEAFQNGLARVTVAGKEAYVTTAGAFVIDPLPGRAGIPTHQVQEIWEGTVGGPGESKSRVRFILIREGAQIRGYFDRLGLLSNVKGQAGPDGSFSMADESGTSWRGQFVSAVLITGVRVNSREVSAIESPMRLRLMRDATIEEVNDADVATKDPATTIGQALCAVCHSKQADILAKGRHAHVACESCHGALASHAKADDPSAHKPQKPDPRNTCIVCHAASIPKPKTFPQVDPADHAPQGGPCTACHTQPHSPKIS